MLSLKHQTLIFKVPKIFYQIHFTNQAKNGAIHFFINDVLCRRFFTIEEFFIWCLIKQYKFFLEREIHKELRIFDWVENYLCRLTELGGCFFSYFSTDINWCACLWKQVITKMFSLELMKESPTYEFKKFLQFSVIYFPFHARDYFQWWELWFE